MDSVIAAKPPEVELRLIKLLMQIAFRSVFGWRDRETYDVEQFSITGIDGSSLSLALRRTRAVSPKGVVVLCHPFLKYGKSWFLRSGYHAWLADAGYRVAAFDFKGFGRSTLGGICFGDDVPAILCWAEDSFLELPIHLIGVSFGAYHAIHSMARHPMRVASVVLDSVPADLRHFFNKGWVGFMVRWLSSSRWGPVTGTTPILPSLSSIGALPCFFLYGDKDRYITVDELALVSSLCPTAKMQIFEDCGHIELKKRHSTAYADAVLSFLDSNSKARQ